jgi:hypothetical protein
VQMTQGGKKMTQVYHSFFPSLRRNHNENMLLLLEGHIWYPEVSLSGLKCITHGGLPGLEYIKYGCMS